MKLNVSREAVYVAPIPDRPGALADKLEPLARAGANLQFLIARRTPDRQPGAVVFVTPLTTPAQVRTAKQAGFKTTRHLHSIRVEGADRPGICAKITRAVADAGLNLRGFSAAAIGKRFVAHLALDTAAAATKAIRIIKGL